MTSSAEHTRPRSSSGLMIVLALVLIAAILLSFCVGRYPLGPGDVVATLWNSLRELVNSQNVSANDPVTTVVTRVRLPRIITVAVAGAGLGMSGAALQGLFRNPLVGPQVVGISSGAAWGGVVAILLGLSSALTVASAFVFALGALVVVFLLSRVGGSARTLALVLAGVIVSSFFSALVGVAQYLANPEQQLPSIVYWLLGSFANASAQSVAVVAVPTVLAGTLLIRARWHLNLFSLDESDARALGVNPDRLRWYILVLVTLIVAAQVSVSGAIGWVGLVVPHIARRLTGADHRALLPASALLGSTYLLLVDDVARTVSAQELPIGVLTALIGTPVFAVVFWNAQRRMWVRD